MTQPSDSERLSSFVLGLYGEDPYAHVYRASEEHRESHGEQCGVYPSSPLSMRLVSLLIRATAAKRILEIGCGLGYSASASSKVKPTMSCLHFPAPTTSSTTTDGSCRSRLTWRRCWT